ncbi:MAG: signal peptidase I [Patescibacteria group bacterium]
MMSATSLMNDNITTTPPSLKPEQKKTFREEALETFRFVLIALAIVVPVRMFVAQPFFVSGASMDPTFADHQYLIVDEISYRFTEPARGEVVIFKYPQNPSQYFIKRIIGLPGETVLITGAGQVTIKSKDAKITTTLNEPYVAFPKSDNIERTLGANEYFVMGDNRAGSFDSRLWGPLERDLIVGKALVRLFPFSTAELLPGQFKQTQ